MNFLDLFPEAVATDIPPSSILVTDPYSNPVSEENKLKSKKSFVEAISNVCVIPTSQLPIPCVKGDRISIMIPEDEYLLGLESCKHNLHGRILWPKGSTPFTVQQLKTKLLSLWSSLQKWGVTSLGKGFFEFSFSSLEDVRRVRASPAWNLNPGILKLFPWTKDFVPSNMNQSSAQVWVRIHGLAQEYWRPKILFTIASSIGTPICIDSSSNKPLLDRPFGHFVRVLVDIDLMKELRDKVLIERTGFAFFVDLEYEKLLDFCDYCKYPGHTVHSRRRKKAAEQQSTVKNDAQQNFAKDNNQNKHNSQPPLMNKGKEPLIDKTPQLGAETSGVLKDKVAFRDPNLSTPVEISKHVGPSSGGVLNNNAILIPTAEIDDPILVDLNAQAKILKAAAVLNQLEISSSDSEFVVETQLAATNNLIDNNHNTANNFLNDSWDNLASKAHI
ncbi:uncharacterized protein LOC131658665 [Vicia villosa]|uniref:uncharacterized protein LOC131658665 n=1 Tax=Vicia villosa TaxID=3911 RepID=UPI00273B2D1C|nr:uncharacterized protein LOC131658665 [Vicia villosa]